MTGLGKCEALGPREGRANGSLYEGSREVSEARWEKGQGGSEMKRKDEKDWAKRYQAKIVALWGASRERKTKPLRVLALFDGRYGAAIPAFFSRRRRPDPINFELSTSAIQ